MAHVEEELIAAGLTPIAGVDEAGRGACAGPLVVAAVILKNFVEGLRDSKELTEAAREEFFPIIYENSEAISVIEIWPDEIDQRGVHAANIDGMRRAVNTLEKVPAYVLTDGYAIEGMAIPSLAIWKGDQVANCISAASIVAKVHRDRIMIELSKKYPQYGFENHKGYVTSIHTQALNKHGVSEIHRRSYANIATLLNN